MSLLLQVYRFLINVNFLDLVFLLVCFSCVGLFRSVVILIFLDGFKVRLMIASVVFVKFVCKDWKF